MTKHSDFINRPIISVLSEAVNASNGIGKGIETYPLSDYILQSTFLKMTGFQEQKFKCIAWDLATHDFEFRRSLLSGQMRLGEYSSFSAKNTIFLNLCNGLHKLDVDFEISHKEELVEESIKLVKSVIEDSNFVPFIQRQLNYFKSQYSIDENDLLIYKNGDDGPNFLKFEMFKKKSSLELSYSKDLYMNRNRIAHNVLSYQQNLPTLDALVDKTDESSNYLIWFTLLVLIDKIIIELFSRFEIGISNSPYMNFDI